MFIGDLFRKKDHYIRSSNVNSDGYIYLYIITPVDKKVSFYKAYIKDYYLK